MPTLIQRAINLESLIMSLPGEHAKGETIGHLLDDLIDTFWDIAPGAVDRINRALDDFHDTYIGR